ncbi:hypothetical protein D3C72_2175670 [compost metagenome]
MKKVTIPATAPMTNAAQGATKAQEPVIATKAASTPFSIAGISAFPYTIQDTSKAKTPPAAAAILVVKATYPKNPSFIADTALPGLNPNQPNQRIITPKIEYTWL